MGNVSCDINLCMDATHYLDIVINLNRCSNLSALTRTYLLMSNTYQKLYKIGRLMRPKLFLKNVHNNDPL